MSRGTGCTLISEAITESSGTRNLGGNLRRRQIQPGWCSCLSDPDCSGLPGVLPLRSVHPVTPRAPTRRSCLGLCLPSPRPVSYRCRIRRKFVGVMLRSASICSAMISLAVLPPTVERPMRRVDRSCFEIQSCSFIKALLRWQNCHWRNGTDGRTRSSEGAAIIDGTLDRRGRRRLGEYCRVSWNCSRTDSGP